MRMAIAVDAALSAVKNLQVTWVPHYRIPTSLDLYPTSTYLEPISEITPVKYGGKS